MVTWEEKKNKLSNPRWIEKTTVQRHTHGIGAIVFYFDCITRRSGKGKFGIISRHKRREGFLQEYDNSMTAKFWKFFQSKG